jgi:plastocyanin
MRRLTLALGALLVCAAPALADKTYTAGPAPFTFTSKDVTIDQGEKLTFQNNDAGGAPHDVTSDQKGLFASETIDQGKSSPVKGVEFLTTGAYAFHCSLHLNMVGTLHVTTAGTPQPKPGSAGDTTAPTATVAIIDSKIGPVLKRKALKVRVKADEGAGVVLSAVASRTTIAKGSVTVKGGSESTVSLKLTASGKKLLKKAKKVTVRLTAIATDPAGNEGAAAASKPLKS